ncbi:MAG: hypothetical protein HQK83_04845 [Fibrobacteria bacterium]|nr:hypothetical protein [Fibrobacteria bacterium]
MVHSFMYKVGWLTFLLASLCFSTPGIDRVNLASKHFLLNIDKSKKELLPELANICEYNYQKLSKVFQYKFKDPVKVIFFDEDDYSNGYALGFKNWVGIYLPSSPFKLRGQSRWLHNVIGHELAHVFTLRKLGYTKWYLGHYNVVQLLGEKYEASFVQGYDIHSLENWLAEGLAQIGAELCGFDTWDSHRSMLERVAYHNDEILKQGELKTFWGNSRQSEQIYNQGYSFMRFVLSALGKKKFELLLRAGRKKGLEKSISKEFGQSFSQVYNTWLESLEEQYGPRKPSKVNSLTKLPMGTDYVVESSPVMTQKGLFFLSSRLNDYGQTHLYRYYQKKIKLIQKDVTGRLEVNRDKSSVLFIRKRYTPMRQVINELCRIESKTLVMKQLTTFGRVYDMASVDNDIYVLTQKGGAQYIQKLTGGKLQTIYASSKAFDIVQITAVPGKAQLLVTLVKSFGADIYLLDLNDNSLTPLINSPADEKDPFLVGENLYFNSDVSGAHQIYQTKLGEKLPLVQLSQEQGGAFQPYVVNDKLYFSAYGARGFVIRSQPLNSVSLPYVPSVTTGDTLHKAVPIPEVKTKSTYYNANNLGFLGVATNLQYFRSPLPESDSVASLGRKLGIGTSLLFFDASLENSAFMDLQLLRVMENPKTSVIDPIVTLGFSTSSYAPVLSAEAQYQSLTLHTKDNDSISEEYLGEVYEPRINQVSFQASGTQRINRNFFLQALTAYQNLGVGVSGISYSFSILKGWHHAGAVVYQDIEPGTDFINSGQSIALIGGVDMYNYFNVDFSDIDENDDNLVLNYEPIEMGSLIFTANSYSNLLRLLFLNMNWQINYQNSWNSDYTDISYEGSLSLKSYLPWKTLSVPIFGRALVFKKWYLSVGAQYENYESREGVVTYMRRNDKNTPFRYQFVDYASPSFNLFGDDRENTYSMNGSLNWKVLTLFNRLSTWSVGVYKSLDNISDDDYMLYFNLSI